MRRFNIAYILCGIALGAFSLYSCVVRTENLDNINIITKPYSLLFADDLGEIFTTFDGERINNLRTTDNIPVEALGTTGEFRLMVKENGTILFVDDGGQGDNVNFNPVYTSINPNAFGNSMMINLPGYVTDSAVKDRLYIASSDPDGIGIAYSDDNAAVDSPWYLVSGDAFIGSSSVTSFTQLLNGTLVAFDDVNRRVWSKASFGDPWVANTGAGLPGAAVGGSGRMYITHQGNDILAVMTQAVAPDNGIWRSSDGGNNFDRLPDILVDDIPIDFSEDITCAEAPFGKVVIACTESNGIFRLDGQGKWSRANVGLEEGTSINAIVYKDNIFKNDKVGEYIYIATSKGVYRSDDLGQSWFPLDVVNNKTKNFTAIH